MELLGRSHSAIRIPIRVLGQAYQVRCYASSITNKSGLGDVKSGTNVIEDPNLFASRNAPRSYPPSSTYSQPRPKESRASHRTSQPTRAKHYPDRFPHMHRPGVIETTPTLVAPDLPFFITRTPSNQLPVYHLQKAGGNKKLTKLRRIDGDLNALSSTLQRSLNLEASDCTINHLTKQILIKGHIKPKIEAFLMAHNF